uniref:Actin n=1 Tax=Gongylonema pulchrum TaxID=637853 RepID=A0A183DU17_9BILA
LDQMDTTVDVKPPSSPVPSKKEYFIGKTFVNVPRANTEIVGCMRDCMIEDWDIFEQMVDYCYRHVLFCESQYQPALFSEAPWNTKAKREKLTELMFEKYNVPAFYVVKNAVLTCYANGRTAGLILDSGATQTSAVPVFDGYCMTHGYQVRSPLSKYLYFAVRAMYSGLTVTGGNSLLMGFTERLNHDLAHKCPPTIKLRVYAAPTPMERRFGAWIGGSILASLGAFQQMWISRAEYDDEGKSIVTKKCA